MAELSEKEATTEVTKKQPRATKPSTVTVFNRTVRAIVVNDASGNGVHIGPKARVQVDANRLGPDFDRLVARRVIEIR